MLSSAETKTFSPRLFSIKRGRKKKEKKKKKRKEKKESVSGSLYNGDLAACLFVHLFIARRSSPFGVHGYAEIR